MDALEEIVSKVKTRTATVESKVKQLEGRVVVQEEYTSALDDWRIQVDEALVELANSPAKTPPIEWWTVSDKEIAVPALVDLGAWVEAVYLNDGGDLHHCWPLHGRHVNELLSLRAMHRKAAGSKGPDDWSSFRKLLRETLLAITHMGTKCGVASHVMFGDHYDLDLAVLDLVEIAEWWVVGKGMDGTIPTCLTLKAEDDR